MARRIRHYLHLFSSRPHKRLIRHYFITSISLICGGLIVSGLVGLYFRYQENRQSLILLQQQVSTAAAFKIEQYVQEIEHTMRAATKHPEIVKKGLTPDYKTELRRLLAVARSITEAVAFDLNGDERTGVSRFKPGLSTISTDPPSSAVLQAAKEGRSDYSALYFAHGSEPYMTISVPIERFVGEIIGVLQAKVSLKHVWEVVTGIKVGDAGYVYVVTRSGYLVAHPDMSLMLRRQSLAHLEPVKTAFGKTPEEPNPKSVVAKNLHGQKVVSSSFLLRRLGWAVFAEQPYEEVYGPIIASTFRTSSLLLFGLGSAVLASVYLARRVARPLRILREGVERIGKGDLDTRIKIKTGDEIEILAEEFNKMTQSLQLAYNNMERKISERTNELAVANQKLQEASQHKSRFLANVNHELRTPVSAIIGFTRLLLRKTEGQIHEAEKAKLQKTMMTAEHLLNVINGLLDLSKIEAGRMELFIEPVNVEEVIQSASSTVEPMLNGHVRLVREISPGIRTLNTDRNKLEQIILNLLSNAVKFTGQGEVKISASPMNGSLKLVVSDSGIGIEKEALSHIFEEFHRGEKSSARKYGGTGLGLAIVRRLVTVLGGDIAVESRVGEGSTFTVTLPLDLRENKHVSAERRSHDEP